MDSYYFTNRLTVTNLSYVCLLLSVLNVCRLLGIYFTWTYCITQLFWPALVVAALYLTKLGATIIFDYFTSSAFVYGGINLGNDMHNNLLKWIGKKVVTSKHATAHTSIKFGEDGAPDQVSSKFLPGYGRLVFRHEGHWILFERKVVPKIRCSQETYEYIRLTTFKWNQEILQTILNDSIPKPEEPKKDFTKVLNIDYDNWYESRSPIRKRPMDSVILSGNRVQSLLEDIRKYLSKGKWYEDRGIPHRRGYLLYGPPGNGKSSLIRALAGELNSDICILSLNHRGLTDDQLNTLMNQAPKNSIILLEDIDAAFISRDDKGASSRETNLAFEGCSDTRITFRGLLNALDGVSSMEGRIVFMTSNHVEKLDPALTRPGRVDVKVLIDNPDACQIEGMFLRFFPKEEFPIENYDELKDKLVKKISSLSQPISMSMIQGLFITYTESPQEVLDNIEDYFNDQFSISIIKSGANSPPPNMYG